jgi:hypothetical protein
MSDSHLIKIFEINELRNNNEKFTNYYSSSHDKKISLVLNFILKAKLNLIMLTFLYMINIHSLACFQIKLKNSSLIVFDDGITNPLFNYSNLPKSDCSFERIFFNYFNDTASDNLDNFDYNSFSIIKNDSDYISNFKLIVNNNITFSFIIIKNSSSNTSNLLEFDIIHKCRTSGSNNFIDKIKKTEEFENMIPADVITESNQSSNWCLIKFEFNYNEKLYSFEYIKFCKEDNFILKLLSMTILLILSLLITYVSTKIDVKMNVVERVREENEIKWWHGFIFILIGSLVLILIFYFIKYLNMIYTVIVAIQCYISFYITQVEFTKSKLLKKLKLKFLADILKFKIFKIKLKTLFFLCSTTIVIYFWLVTRHWILNNLLAFSLVFLVLSLLEIKSFKICILLLICIFIYDSFWVFYSSSIFQKNVMLTVATNMNLPIKLELPLFFINNPIKNCLLLGLGDIVLPGLIIKFCRNFDKIKNSERLSDRNGYYKTVFILYIISLISAFAASYIFSHAQPVLFYIAPIFILGLVFYSLKRGEFYDFYKGSNISGTRVVVEEIINGEFTRLENVNDNNTQNQNI